MLVDAIYELRCALRFVEFGLDCGFMDSFIRCSVFSAVWRALWLWLLRTSENKNGVMAATLTPEQEDVSSLVLISMWFELRVLYCS